MTCGIRSFSSYLSDAARILEHSPPLEGLDQCVGRLAEVMGFDSAWYGFMGWGQVDIGVARGSLAKLSGFGAVMHGTAGLNLPSGFFQAWQEMRHEDLLLDEISNAPGQVAVYHCGQSVQTNGMAAMAERYDLGAIATATQIQPDRRGSLFLACYRNGGVAVRNWNADEQEFLYSAVEVLDRLVRDSADRDAKRGAKGVELHVSAVGCCILGRASLRALGIDADGPLRYRLEAAFRTALACAGRLLVNDLGLAITATSAKCADDGGLRVIQVDLLSSADRLSPREAEVATLLAQGLSHKQVARQLDIAPATVRNQTRGIYDKLRVNNRATLIAALGGTAVDRSS